MRHSDKENHHVPRGLRLCRRLGVVCVVLGLGPWLVSASLAPVKGKTHSGKAARFTQAVTVPFLLDHNRMIVEVGFPKVDGTVRRAAAWVDTGNAALVLTERLAREMGLPEGGEAKPEVRAITFGQQTLDTSSVPVKTRPGRWVMPGVPAEVQLPLSVFRGLLVVLDYPAETLTVAPPGTRTPRGQPVPCLIHPETGLLQITASVEGEPVSLGLDTGSAGTWVSDRLAGAWLSSHPDWPRATGAAGSANFFGFPFEAAGLMLQLPRLSIGAAVLFRVPVLGLDQGLFDWYSQKTARPVGGFIGANVLRKFRLEIDLARGLTWWDPGPSADCAEPAIVGLTLRPEGEGPWTVAGVLRKGGQPVLSGVEPGDRLVSVDGQETAPATMGDIVTALRGRAGEARSLLLERGGQRVRVVVPVADHP